MTLAFNDLKQPIKSTFPAMYIAIHISPFEGIDKTVILNFHITLGCLIQGFESKDKGGGMFPKI